MSTITRPLAGPNLVFAIGDQIAELRKDENYVRSGRAGRTLVKTLPLSITLVVMSRGTEIATHHAEAPMTLQPVEGRLRFRVGTEEIVLEQGELLYFGPGQAQDIVALEDTALLLTIGGAD